MDLVGRLSNPELTTSFQSLTAHDWTQGERRRRFATPGAPDGRRKFGTVRDSIVAVLEEAGSELRVRDIHQRVEQLLGEPVAGSSVKNYLHKAARRKVPLFEYRGRRGYRLAR